MRYLTAGIATTKQKYHLIEYLQNINILSFCNYWIPTSINLLLLHFYRILLMLIHPKGMIFLALK